MDRKIIKIKDITLGNGQISIQTMLSSKTVLVEENLLEIERLKAAGCDLVRIAVSNDEDIVAFKSICERSSLPIISDIQYDYKLAISSIENGASKVRINPSNIGEDSKVKMVVDCAKLHHVPIRVGVNMGSLDKEIEREFGRTSMALAKSCVKHANLLESMGFEGIVLSVKASNVKTMVEACALVDKMSPYPQHIGVTEAGTLQTGVVKNAMGIGALLLQGIGDTIRVSLSAPPIEEVYAGKRILKSLNMRKGVTVVSCPTCNRCDYDLFSLAKEIEEMTFNLEENLTIAVMGCAVNGIGEGKDADIGIAGGKDKFVIFKKGKILKTVDKNCYKEVFIRLVKEGILGKN